MLNFIKRDFNTKFYCLVSSPCHVRGINSIIAFSDVKRKIRMFIFNSDRRSRFTRDKKNGGMIKRETPNPRRKFYVI